MMAGSYLPVLPETRLSAFQFFQADPPEWCFTVSTLPSSVPQIEGFSIKAVISFVANGLEGGDGCSAKCHRTDSDSVAQTTFLPRSRARARRLSCSSHRSAAIRARFNAT